MKGENKRRRIFPCCKEWINGYKKREREGWPIETNYRIAYEKGWRDLKQKEPQEVAKRLALSYSRGDRQFCLPFFQRDCLLDWDSETVFAKDDGQSLPIDAAIIILNYLSFSHTPQDVSGRWVTLKELPGGALFYPAFRKTAIAALIGAFGREPQNLVAAARPLAGRPGESGDAAAVFQALPKVPLAVTVWTGDEEIAANAALLYDPSAAHFLHIECAIGLGMYLAAQLSGKTA